MLSVTRCLPVLSNLKGPIELEMGLLVVVNKARGNMVCASDEHAAWGRLFLDC